jgi:sugar O-acyltransferase (sialic acid O-acetyltransferase NeuD family)
MTKLFSVLVPLVNTNEVDSMLVSLAVKEGQFVKKDELMAVFETTKSTFDLLAEQEGYILGLNHNEGDTLHVGDRLCYLSETTDAPLPVEEEPEKTNIQSITAPEDLRITQPALKLAQEMGVDLSLLPRESLITETVVRELFSAADVKLDPTAVVIYGGGGHAKALIELMRAEGKYRVNGVLDDHLPVGSQILGVPVLGGGDYLLRLRAQGIGLVVNAVGGIGDITPRLKIYEKIKAAGLKVPTVVHPRAFIEQSAQLAEGQQVFFNCYVGSDVRVGYGCILNTGSILSHDCVLADFVNISPGAILAGSVQVGQRTLIGMGVTINLGVKVGNGVRIGNSAVVKADVPDGTIIRAGAIWPPVA